MNTEINFLIEIVCEYFEITREQLTSRSRERQLVDARHIIIKISRERFRTTFKKLSEIFNLSHGSLVYAEKKPMPLDLEPHFNKILHIFENGKHLRCENCGHAIQI